MSKLSNPICLCAVVSSVLVCSIPPPPVTSSRYNCQHLASLYYNIMLHTLNMPALDTVLGTNTHTMGALLASIVGN